MRDLRNQTAAAVRRAGAGERIVVTVDGRPLAQLGPLDPLASSATLDDLVSRGLLIRARRRDRPAPDVGSTCGPAPASTGRRECAVADAGPPLESGGRHRSLDTSALLARYVSRAAPRVVLDAMAADPDWCASALALTEALMLVDRLTDPGQAVDLRRALRDDWDRFHVVPPDQAASTAPPTSGVSTRCAPSTPSTWRPPTGSRAHHLPHVRPHQIPVALRSASRWSPRRRRGARRPGGRHPGGMIEP